MVVENSAPADDWSLLEAYCAGCQESFQKLVKRHVAMVYGVCLRRLGDAHLAEDVTQAVFVILARRAGNLRTGTVLGAWLYKTAGFCCSNARQTKRTRDFHEGRFSPPLRPVDAGVSTVEWEEIESFLDAGILKLPKPQRDTLVLRYFEEKTIPEIADATGQTVYRTQQNLKRGLAALRRFLSSRGVSISVVALAAGLAATGARAAQIVPAGLCMSATAAATGTKAALGGGVAVVVSNALHALALARLKAALIGGVLAFGLILAAMGITTSHRATVADVVAAEQKNSSAAAQKDVAEFQALLERAGRALRQADTAQLQECCILDDPAQLRDWQAMARVWRAQLAAEATARERFGPAGTGLANMAGLGDRLDVALASVDRAATEFGADGDRGWVRFSYALPGGPVRGGSIYFVRVDGAWRIDAVRSARAVIAASAPDGSIRDIETLDEPAQQAALARLAAMAEGIDQFTKRLRAGEFVELAAAQEELRRAAATPTEGLRVFYRLELCADQRGMDRLARLE